MKDKNRAKVGPAKELVIAKKKLEKLNDWEERYKSLVKVSPCAVTITDLDGKIIDLSRKTLTMYGYKRLDELLGKSASKLIAPTDRKKAAVNMQKILDKGLVKDAVYTMVKKNGKQFLGEVDASIIKDSRGKRIAFIATIRDITEQKMKEEALRESEGKYRTIVEHSLQGIIIIQDFHIVYANEAFAKISGYTAEELTNFSPDHVKQLVHPEDRAMVWGRMASRLAGKDVPPRYEYRGIKKDGSIVWLEMVASRIEYRGNLAVYGAVIDITDRKQADDQIQAALREKEVMLREMHHRVKNNMQIILSLLRIQSRAVKDRGTLEMFKQSQNRIRSMALIHEGLYKSGDLANIDIGDYISRMTTHMLSIYREDLGEIDIKQEAKGVYLDVNRAIPCGLIISELVSNSLKHAFPGKKKGQITIHMARDKKGVNSLTITDNGTGFPEGLNFRETETLGLQLVTDLVQQLNGSISLKKTEGTEFLVKF